MCIRDRYKGAISMKEKYRPYSNATLIIMGILGLGGAATILTLFIIFVSISKPSFHDLSKLDFAVLCVDFALLVVYGVVTFMTDPKISDYGVKTWLSAVLLFATVAVLNTTALYRHHDRVLPVISLCIPLAAATIIILVNSQFYFCEAVIRNPRRSFRRQPTQEEYSDFEDDSVSTGSIAVEIPAPYNSPIKEHFALDSSGNAWWRKTHFMVAIEDGARMKRRWRQIVGGVKAWLKGLAKSKDVVVSVFTFDVTGQNGKFYRKPSELVKTIEEMVPSGAARISLEGPVSSFVEVMNDDCGKSMRGAEWLHYGVLITAEGSGTPKEALSAVQKFKRRYKLNFFLNTISQTEMVGEINKLVKELEGVHYIINKGANFGKAFVEAMNKNPIGA
eukprot:TRINITY_DN13040_c0_g1_i1.p1 TRINITY_DN13040_c0_g1~~TRINITY_DN13040_c0_g1_i1.p1  ORF type:complete len:390 (-),score=50.95 TRINITY_DN13040_c0_g1_i1:92-1261(-)